MANPSSSSTKRRKPHSNSSLQIAFPNYALVTPLYFWVIYILSLSKNIMSLPTRSYIPYYNNLRISLLSLHHSFQVNLLTIRFHFSPIIHQPKAYPYIQKTKIERIIDEIFGLALFSRDKSFIIACSPCQKERRHFVFFRL